MAFCGDFAPVLAKHTKSFNLIDTLAVGGDRIQRSFGPMRKQVEVWRQSQISDVAPNSFSTKHSWTESSTHRRVCFLRFTVTTSSQNMRSFLHVRCGVSRMHSRVLSKFSTQSRSLELRPNS